MPLEIRELIIKAAIEEEDGQASPQPSGTCGDQMQNTNAIVNLCVEKVLKIIKEKTCITLKTSHINES